LAKKVGKHTPYFELVDAQTQAGCPICRLVYRATDRYLDGILYECTLDPDVRLKLKNSHGFCAEHVEMMRRKAGRALGVALIYRDIIQKIVQATEKGQRPTTSRAFFRRLFGRSKYNEVIAAKLRPTESCPACAIKRKATENYESLLVAHLEDERLFEAYAQGEGLCLPHLVETIERIDDPEKLRRLLEPQITRYREMIADLNEYIRKRDHRFKGEPFGPEGDVWLRAMNAVVGGAGMGLSAKSGGRRTADINPTR